MCCRKQTGCFKKKSWDGWCLCCFILVQFFIVQGIFALACKGLPWLPQYSDIQDIHTKCELQNAKIQEIRKCSHKVSCGEYCTTTVHSTFSCFYVNVSYQHSNGSTVTTKLFRSYKDGEATNFECSVYECEENDQIKSTQKKLKSQGVSNVTIIRISLIMFMMVLTCSIQKGSGSYLDF